QSSPSLTCQSMEERTECLRRKIKYYFMNPCEKYHARGRIPWKLMLQIVKIAIITMQLVLFGLSNQMVVTFKEENLLTFKHLFLKDYVDGGMETYAVYRQADVYDHIDYIITQYGLLHNNTVGNHEYEKSGSSYNPLLLCQDFYRNGSIYPGSETFEIDAHVHTECLKIYPANPEPLRDMPENFELHFKRLLLVKITFAVMAINLQTVRYRELPDCYDFTVIITFNNQAHSGRMTVDLEMDVEINECKDWKVIGACKFTKLSAHWSAWVFLNLRLKDFLFSFHSFSCKKDLPDRDVRLIYNVGIQHPSLC
uniref:Mucolipin TRP cation channel 3 n=1 Tax=Poecilia reticulata TaxID=8081 RepID=A0A3P9QBU4_POERE